jgi:hypothetical protein
MTNKDSDPESLVNLCHHMRRMADLVADQIDADRLSRIADVAEAQAARITKLEAEWANNPLTHKLMECLDFEEARAERLEAEVVRLCEEREAEDMLLARDAYDQAVKDYVSGRVARDPRVILAKTRAALQEKPHE